MLFNNFVPVFLAGVVGFCAAAPAPKPEALSFRFFHREKAMDEIVRFKAQVEDIAKGGNKVIKEFETREPLQSDKQPIYEFMYQILQDRVKVREYQFDLRSAIDAVENYFTTTYTKKLTGDEQMARMGAMDQAEQELTAWKTFLATPLSKRLTASMFDAEVKEYMSEQKTEAGQRDRLAAFGKNHKRTLTAKNNLWKELTLAQRQMDDGMKIADGMWIEEQRLEAYEREGDRQRARGSTIRRVNSIETHDSDSDSELDLE